MFAQMLTTRTIRKPGLPALALSGLMLLAPAPAWAQTATNVVCTGCVHSSDIRDGTGVQSIDIYDGTVSAADIGTGAVGSAEIGTGAVGSDEIGTGAVGSDEIGTGAVGSDEIVDGTVTSADIADGAVTGADLAANVLTGANIGDGSVTGADIAVGAINSSHIIDGGVTSADIADGTVSLNDLAFDPTATAPGDSGVMLIPAAAFHPVLDGTPFSFSIAGGYIAPGAPGDILPTETCVAAPVDLRNGVTILAFQGIFYDNSPVALVELSLFEVSLYGWRLGTGAVSPGCDETFHDDPWESPCESPSPLPALAPTPTTLAHATTSLEGTGDWLALDTAVLSATVDTANNAYYVGECFASDTNSVDNTRLYGARIYYQ